MNNIPENNNQLEPTIDNEDIFENSTIFSAPKEHAKKSTDFKKKKYLPAILASILAVVILAGSIFAIIKFIPERTEEETSEPSFQEIEVLTANSSDFKLVNIINTNGNFKLFPKESSDTVTWYIEGFKEGILDSSSIAYVVDDLAAITASREVTQRTAKDCGLDKPSVKAEITDKNGKKFSVLFGSESPDKSGYYLKLSTSDKIYVVSTYLYETVNFTAVSLGNTNILPALDITSVSAKYKGDDGLLASCDKITLSGKNFSKPVVIEPNYDKMVSVYAPYNITSPTKRAAENVEGVFEIFKSGVTVMGVYAVDKTAASLKKFDLDKPDLTAKIEVEGKTLTYKFKLQGDGYYAAVCDTDPLIKQVDAQAIPFVDYKISDYYSSWVCLNGIDNLKSFSVTVDGKTHTFSIKANPEEKEDQLYFVNYNGRELSSPKFQEFYKSCIGLMCSDFTIDKASENDKITFVYTYNDDIGGSQKVEFKKVSESKYQYFVDGEAMGKITASSLRKIEKSLEALIKE